MFRCLVVLTLLAGCASKHELARCKGPLIVLNTDKWHPTAYDVAALEKICPEDR